MATIRVTNQTELDVAVKSAKAGDTVVLAAGNYKQLWVDDKISTSAVTFKSESATNPAVIGYVRALRSEGVVFQDLKVGRQLVTGVDQDWTNMALVQESKNVSFSGVQFFSTGADDKYLGRGIFIRSSANVTVKGSDFSHLAVGMQSMSVDGLTVQQNKFHDLRIDGTEFTAVKNVLIDGNDFRDFRSSEIDHPDAIQFWTNGTKLPSTDVVISNNVILPGNGKGSQGIFIQDEIGGIPYERITIKNNLLLDKGEYWNGITVRGGKDITIEGNTSISPTTDKNVFWIRLDNIVGAKVTNNLADQLIQSNAKGLVQSGNVFLNEQKTFASKISGINLGVKATVSSLIVSGVGYQSTSSAIAPVTTAPTPSVLSPVVSSPIAQVAAAAPVSAVGASAEGSISVLQPTSLASTLTPIATTPTATTTAAPVVSSAAAAPAAPTATVAAPAMTAKQQKAAAKAAAAAAKALAKQQKAAAKAAAKAAKSKKSSTAIAVAPVVSQPMIPVAAAPIGSISTIGNTSFMGSGSDFFAGGF